MNIIPFVILANEKNEFSGQIKNIQGIFNDDGGNWNLQELPGQQTEILSLNSNMIYWSTNQQAVEEFVTQNITALEANSQENKIIVLTNPKVDRKQIIELFRKLPIASYKFIRILPSDPKYDALRRVLKMFQNRNPSEDENHKRGSSGNTVNARAKSGISSSYYSLADEMSFSCHTHFLSNFTIIKGEAKTLNENLATAIVLPLFERDSITSASVADCLVLAHKAFGAEAPTALQIKKRTQTKWQALFTLFYSLLISHGQGAQAEILEGVPQDGYIRLRFKKGPQPKNNIIQKLESASIASGFWEVERSDDEYTDIKLLCTNT
jgi:hypothetical protein